MLRATNTNFIVFGLTRSGLESTIYRTRSENANHYTTDAVNINKAHAIMSTIQKMLFRSRKKNHMLGEWKPNAMFDNNNN
jgi:hypothetical protein